LISFFVDLLFSPIAFGKNHQRKAGYIKGKVEIIKERVRNSKGRAGNCKGRA